MRSKLLCGALALSPLFVACDQVTDVSDEAVSDRVGADMEAIVGGVPASAYPEGAILNMKSASGENYACSATLIAPKVVLTAGHCVDGIAAWDVYVGTAYRPAIGGETFDWKENGATTVNPQHHDIGLVYLKDAITQPTYPTLSAVKQPDGTSALAIGRILNGTLTNSLYQAKTTLSDATKIGYPFAYYSPAVIEHGDSGGPVMLSGTHTIAAVNSGAGSGTQVLARVDLLSAWVAQRIASHAVTTTTPSSGAAGAMSVSAGAAAPKAGAGGAAGSVAAKAGAGGSDAAKGGAGGAAGSVAAKGGAGGAAGSVAANAGAGGSAPTAGAKASAGAGGAAGAIVACSAELEPNNDFAHASTITGTTCGSLASASDVDWLVMPLSTGTTTLTLTADKDATFSIGYVAGTTCATALTGARQVQVTASAANAKVCMAVSSATHTVQSYKISR